MTVHRLAFVLFLLSCVAAALSPAFALGTTERVSVSSAGAEANAGGGTWSTSRCISADGRYVAFQSAATNLAPGDTNGCVDLFVHDRDTRVTERVSLSSTGAEGDSVSWHGAISGDGRYVAFESVATNLVEGDTNGCADIFVHDRETGATERVSVSSTGAEGNNHSQYTAISADGRYVAFLSSATNLVDGDTNGKADMFAHDRDTGTTERVSVDSAGVEANDRSSLWPSISADGRYVAFMSYASNLVTGDTNGYSDIFVHDRDTGATERVSVNSAGGQANDDSETPSISADGRHVAFASAATNLVEGDTNWCAGCEDIFVHDRQTGATERASVDSAGGQASEYSTSLCPSISQDGRYVAFDSTATNLVAGDTNGCADTFVHDRQTGATKRVSVSTGGAEANNDSWYASISGDGQSVAFQSLATNLVDGDTNEEWDVFVHGALPYPVPEVLLEVHPNERAPGSSTGQVIGGQAWVRPAHVPGAMYWWKHHRFVGSDALWIQVCAQNWNAIQNGTGDDDNIRMRIDGFVPVDYDLIQNGPWGAYQWRGDKEHGHRWALRFLYLGPNPLPVLHALQFEADETPVVWWVKVTDLEPGVVEAF